MYVIEVKGEPLATVKTVQEIKNVCVDGLEHVKAIKVECVNLSTGETMMMSDYAINALREYDLCEVVIVYTVKDESIKKDVLTVQQLLYKIMMKQLNRDDLNTIFDIKL